MTALHETRVAILATDGFEESELVEPAGTLRNTEAEVEVLAPKEGVIQGFRHFDKGSVISVTHTLSDAKPDDYDALLLPGGVHNADALRVVPEAQDFVRTLQEGGKPIAVICHGAWLLVSANLVRGRRLTSYHTLKDDIRNAGGIWLDQEVVEDRNWVSSRRPSDLPAFQKAMLKLFAHVPTGARLE